MFNLEKLKAGLLFAVITVCTFSCNPCSINNLVGNYSVNESCTTGNYNYDIEISESSSKGKIVIDNLYDYGEVITATCEDESFSFDETKGGLNYSGSGFFSGNVLTIIFTVSSIGSDDCTVTAVKK
jgi:hypothetical protein